MTEYFVYFESYLNNRSLADLQTQASHCQSYVDRQQWTMATNCWSAMESVLESV